MVSSITSKLIIFALILYRPCLNGGTCTNDIGTYSCQCTPEFTGSNCQEEVQVCGGYFTGDAGEIDYPIGMYFLESDLILHSILCRKQKFPFWEMAICSPNFVPSRER